MVIDCYCTKIHRQTSEVKVDSWVSLKSVGIKDSQSRLVLRLELRRLHFLKTKQSIIIFKEIFLLKNPKEPRRRIHSSHLPPNTTLLCKALRDTSLSCSWRRSLPYDKHTHFMVGRKVRFSNPWCSKNSSRCCLGWSAATTKVGLESRKNDAVMPGQGPSMWSGMRSIN